MTTRFPTIGNFLFLFIGFIAFGTIASRTAAQIDDLTSDDPIPIMAYYYIWFDVSSWDRAKVDYPLLGRYSSDNEEVMHQHIEWAKEAGIDGFIVSWKSTFQLDTRLEKLIKIAEEHDFYLWIIYQGLDFDRNPQPVARIDADLEYFLENYAQSKVFSLFDQPVIIWSGTWEFSREEVEAVTSKYRTEAYILATERNVPNYMNIADLVDGNAYYWSSVNPDTYPDYQGKLDEMSKSIHNFGGIWVAPAAPGFDARLIGGTTTVDRKEGETLRIQMNTALRSSPDVIGLISWNEFSENSHVEPSINFGHTSLDTLIGRATTRVAVPIDFDSSAPGGTHRDSLHPFFILGAVMLISVISIGAIYLRRS